MKKIEYCITFCLLLFFSSCQKQTDTYTGFHDSVEVLEVEFPDNAEVLKPIFLPQVGNQLGNTGDMKISGNYLVFSNQTDSVVLQFFSLADDYAHIGNFGNLGQGPNEFGLRPIFTSHSPTNQPILSMFDFIRGVVYLVNVADLIQTRELTSAPKISLPPEGFTTHRAAFVAEDSSIIGFGGVEIGKLFKYDSRIDSISAVTPFIPEHGIRTFRKSSFYSGRMIVNTDKGIIAVVSRSFKQMEYYDLGPTKNLSF